MRRDGIHLFFTATFLTGIFLFSASVQSSPYTDFDGDGLSDSWEDAYGFNFFGANESALDSDNDGLTNLKEFSNGLHPLVSNATSDLDSDSIIDTQEILLHGTHPLNNDSDADGMPDGWEINYNLNPLNRSDAASDLDGDGLKNINEYQAGTNPALANSDTDGVVDGLDDLPLVNTESVDTDKDGIGNNTDADDDNDGITDVVEIGNCIYGIWNNGCTNRLLEDTDLDTINDNIEIQNGTNPVGHLLFFFFIKQGDLDSDGMPNNWESLYALSSPTADADGDGVNNLSEYTHGSNPTLTDSDFDGFSDALEINNNRDPANALDTLQFIMATGQSLSLGNLGVNSDPTNPTKHFTITKTPAYSGCPFGYCLMLNTGSRGVLNNKVNTLEHPLTHFENFYEGSATVGPFRCINNGSWSNDCDPRESQGAGLLKQMYGLQALNPSVEPSPFIFRSHGNGGQLYNPTRDPAYNIANDPDHLLGLRQGTRPYINAFGPVELDNSSLVNGELDSVIQIAGNPALSPWPAEKNIEQPRNVNVRAVIITHGESDRLINNQFYDDDLREWVDDYHQEIMARTNQALAPAFLVDQLRTFPFSNGHKIQLDQLDVADELTNVYLTGPKYHLPYSQDQLHLTMEGYHLLGEYHAKVIHKLMLGEAWQPLQPESIVLAGNAIDIEFHIPEGSSLLLDTVACNRVTGAPGNYDDYYGFQYREGVDGSIAPTIKISSISFSGNIAHITLSGTPDRNNYPRINYAYDAPGLLTCGGLRDNYAQQQISSLPVGSPQAGTLLHNWAVTFSKQIDSDQDGLPDGWEANNSLDPLNANDSNIDSDGDTLNNTEEFQLGLNPVNSDTDGDGLNDGYEVHTSLTLPGDSDTDNDMLNDGDELNVHNTDPFNPDTDGDGMSDGYEVMFGFDPLNPLDAVEDADNDGLTNLQEYQSGSSPIDANDVIWPLNGVYKGGSFKVFSTAHP